MAFKGTSRRTARQIAEEVEAVGGDINAATSVESTAYYARMMRADVPLALDVLSDILADPSFDLDELAREQSVIVQEIGACEDTPDDLVFDFLQSTAFPNQPVGRSILGTPQTVRSFDASRLRAYLGRNYRAPDMVVAAAGAVEHGAILDEVERRFASFVGPHAPMPEPARYGGGARLETRELEQVHVTLAMEGVPQRDPTLYSLQVFTNVLGGGMSSRLFQEVREVRGLCYAIYTFHWPYSDTGLFGLYAGTDAADAPELMRVVDRRDRRCGRDHHRGRGQSRQGADEGRLADGAGKLGRARRTAGAANPGLRSSDPDRRDRRQGRCGDGRERARRWPRPDGAQPAGHRRARARPGT